MRYENGMQIIWDVITRSIVIIFRNTVIDLPGPFGDQQTAVAAAEERCRELGWDSDNSAVTPALG